MKSPFKKDILEGKIALVTVGATGICFGIAKALLEHGACVAIASRKLDNLKDAV